MSHLQAFDVSSFRNSSIILVFLILVVGCRSGGAPEAISLFVETRDVLMPELPHSLRRELINSPHTASCFNLLTIQFCLNETC